MVNWENVIADETHIMNTHFNAGRSGAKINKIVLHHNAGNLSIMDCYNVWQTREASAHYQVDANGRIGQLVNDWDTAWHAGNWDANVSSIGIEHADISSNPWRISNATLESGAHLVAALCKHYGLGRPTWLVNVFPHSYFSSTACPASIAGDQNAAYMKRAGEWYDAMMKGVSAPAAAPSAPAPSAPKATPKIPVHYSLRSLNGGWLPDVTNFNNSDDNGFAGIPNQRHDLLVAWVDKGKLKYRVHVLGGGWLPWVDHADKNDIVNGTAGNPGQAIDGVQFYYTTPGDLASKGTYYQAWYRSQTTDRAGWLNACSDDGTNNDGGDSWAGMLGEPLDRLQLAITNGNPF